MATDITQSSDTLDELSKLALKHGTDKWSRKHHYTPIYYNLFKDRQKSIKKVLEIGVGEGAGLRMLRDFFPNAKIYGAEIDPKRIFEDGMIKVYRCDRTSKRDLDLLIEETGPDIDLILEDAAHEPKDQVFTCLTLMPLLKKDVVYIIEDVADPNILNQLSLYDCEMLKVGRRYDDRLIIVRNNGADELDELSKLALKYGADKSGRKINYTPVYYDLFNKRKDSVKKVLEIGIGEGASLKMWRDFFPNAKIFGADYMPSRLIKEDRIESFLFDQRRREHIVRLIQQIGSDIDLVVEDASHRSRDQIFTCLNMMPLLNKEVTYIIEDVADPGIIERFLEYDVEIPELPIIRRYDNKLVIVRHKKRSNISFFAKKPTHVPPDGHLQRVSSIVRAYQIAEYIGAKVNPTEGYQNDICIYVKPPYKPGSNLLFEGKPYLDICDAYYFYEVAKKHPQMPVISTSDWNYKTLKRILPNKIINIPEQHCNYERIKKNYTGIRAVGCIGTYHAFRYLPKGLKETLATRNIELIEFSKFFTRQDVVDFYMRIDVQIVWRPYPDYSKDILMNPRKIVNASSFGIPTIAYDEPAFKEMEGCYIPVHSLEEFLTQLDNLRANPKIYEEYSKRCLKKAEKYHIEKIAKLYKNLT